MTPAHPTLLAIIAPKLAAAKDPREMTKAQVLKALAELGVTNIKKHGKFQIEADVPYRGKVYTGSLYDPRDLLRELREGAQ
jgi:hypothetical protein